MSSKNLQLVTEKMLSDDPELRAEAILVLHEKMDEHDDFTDILIQAVDKLIHCTKETQADVLKELPMLLGSGASRVLIPFLASPFSEIRSLVTTLLVDCPLGQHEIDIIYDLLEHNSQDVRNSAVEVLVTDGQEELLTMNRFTP